jgi:hypothetical protein
VEIEVKLGFCGDGASLLPSDKQLRLENPGAVRGLVQCRTAPAVSQLLRCHHEQRLCIV